MARNKGTQEGDAAEIEFVQSFNRGHFSHFCKANFPSDVKPIAVRVSSHQFSETSQAFVKPKADAFLIISEDLRHRLIAQEYFLDESDLDSASYAVIKDSGISIKRPDATKYQIHKFTPRSFMTVIGDRYLGAGALIYINNSIKRRENENIIKAWGISINQFCSHFAKLLKIDHMEIPNKFVEIQRYCLTNIKQQILADENKLEIVFSGRDVFASPYFAAFTYVAGDLGRLQFSDFLVTQGSNRTKNPTIVLKPQLS